MVEYKFNVTENTTLYNFLKFHSGASTRLFYKLKASQIFINNSLADMHAFVNIGDMITIILEETSGDIIPEKIDLDIIFEDDYLLAVNKPANMVVHPTCFHQTGTLVNAVCYYFKTKNLDITLRPVIRLDKDTSGLVIFAKNALVQELITQQMKQGTVIKSYYALVEGIPLKDSGRIDLPIARLEGSIISRCISENGVKAITNYSLVKSFPDYSLLEITPETGRTHQIRVHMQAIGHPILADSLYGHSSKYIRRQALHAYSYSFLHPITNQTIILICEMPKDFLNLV